MLNKHFRIIFYNIYFIDDKKLIFREFYLPLHLITAQSIIVEKDIEIEGINLHYTEVGPNDGIPIILLHGWGCNHSTLKSIENILSEKMHVYSLDIAGHGQSDEPTTVWGIDDFTRQLEIFIKTLNIDRPILLGHSFGGRMSILYSSRNEVRKVILVDAAGVKPHRKLKYYFKVYSYKAIKKIVPMIVGKQLGEQLINKYRKKAGSSDYNNASPRMRAIMSRCVNEDLCKFMPKIKAPVLLIWGTEDTATPLSDAKKMEQLIPDTGLVSFDGCGHYSFLDNPVGFKAVLKEFLKKELV